MFLLEQVVNGLVLGGYYLLIALGLSLIFSVGGIVNLAHGAFYAFGAYVAVALTNYLGFGPAVVASPVAVGMLGILFERFILRRFYNADPVLSLLVTFGLAMMAEQLLRIIWGAAPLSQTMPQSLKGAVFIGDFLLSRYRLMLLAIVAAILLGIWLLLQKTAFGRVVRAGIQRPDMASNSFSRPTIWRKVRLASSQKAAALHWLPSFPARPGRQAWKSYTAATRKNFSWKVGV